MLAVMGLMVGFYILTRMFELSSALSKEPKLRFTGVMAVITIFVTLGAMVYFILGPDLMKGLAGFK